jgi:hypothetical protein
MGVYHGVGSIVEAVAGCAGSAAATAGMRGMFNRIETEWPVAGYILRSWD